MGCLVVLVEWLETYKKGLIADLVRAVCVELWVPKVNLSCSPSETAGTCFKSFLEIFRIFWISPGTCRLLFQFQDSHILRGAVCQSNLLDPEFFHLTVQYTQLAGGRARDPPTLGSTVSRRHRMPLAFEELSPRCHLAVGRGCRIQ